MNGRKKKIIIYVAGLLAVGVFLLAITAGPGNERQLVVTFIDVGQGDSILIRTPSHQNILIDGGPDTSVLDGLGRALPFYDHTIDLMVLTHAHADHSIGLVEVLKRYDVKQVLYNGVPTTTAEFLAWLDVIHEKHINTTMAQAGQSWQFGEVALDVLYPLENVSTQTFKDLNSSSVVTQLRYQDTSFLLTGDAPVDVENKLISAYGRRLKSDVLKVGHHGSRYSSSEEFLQLVKPQYAVISVGADNKFGHPHRLTLTALKKIGSIVLRTDEQGTVTCSSDGHRITCP